MNKKTFLILTALISCNHLYTVVNVKKADNKTQSVGSRSRSGKKKSKPHNAPATPNNTIASDEQYSTLHTAEEQEFIHSIAHLPTEDKIIATIYAQEGSEVITLSDIKKIGVDGQPRTRDGVILEQLMFQDAQRYNIKLDERMIDKYIMTMKQTHGITDKDIEAMFANSGYTMEDGREQLRIMNSVQSLLDFKIKSRLIIPEKDILAYYELHPALEEASYQLQRVFIPFDTNISKEEQRSLLMQQINDGYAFKWGMAYWRDHSALPENKKFISTMKVGEISEPLETTGGFEIIRLKDFTAERKRSLEELRNQIVNILKLPEYKRQMALYKEQLLQSASVIYFDIE